MEGLPWRGSRPTRRPGRVALSYLLPTDRCDRCSPNTRDGQKPFPPHGGVSKGRHRGYSPSSDAGERRCLCGLAHFVADKSSHACAPRENSAAERGLGVHIVHMSADRRCESAPVIPSAADHAFLSVLCLGFPGDKYLARRCWSASLVSPPPSPPSSTPYLGIGPRDEPAIVALRARLEPTQPGAPREPPSPANASGNIGAVSVHTLLREIGTWRFQCKRRTRRPSGIFVSPAAALMAASSASLAFPGAPCMACLDIRTDVVPPGPHDGPDAVQSRWLRFLAAESPLNCAWVTEYSHSEVRPASIFAEGFAKSCWLPTPQVSEPDNGDPLVLSRLAGCASIYSR